MKCLELSTYVFLCIKFPLVCWLCFHLYVVFLCIKFLVYFLMQGWDHDFHVIHISNSVDKYVVNLQKMMCGCRNWYLTGLPCCHAIACIKTNITILLTMCRPFTRKNNVECYSSIIYPVNGQNLWMMTEYTDLQPPAIKKEPGRPKKKRSLDSSELLRDSGQMKRASYGIKCSRCKESRHNKSTCPLPPPPPPPPESETQTHTQAQVEIQTSQPKYLRLKLLRVKLLRVKLLGHRLLRSEMHQLGRERLRIQFLLLKILSHNLLVVNHLSLKLLEFHELGS